jgi:hypothetical protein
MRSTRTSYWLGAGVLLLAAAALAQTTFKSPDSVKTGLRIISQVVRHTGRLIDAKNYDQVPHETGEFDEGMQTLQEGVGTQATEFKAKLDPLLAKARVASNAMSAAAMAHNDPQLRSAHDQFATAVGSVVELFPADLRPKPPAPAPAP